MRFKCRLLKLLADCSCVLHLLITPSLLPPVSVVVKRVGSGCDSCLCDIFGSNAAHPNTRPRRELYTVTTLLTSFRT